MGCFRYQELASIGVRQSLFKNDQQSSHTTEQKSDYCLMFYAGDGRIGFDPKVERLIHELSQPLEGITTVGDPKNGGGVVIVRP